MLVGDDDDATMANDRDRCRRVVDERPSSSSATSSFVGGIFCGRRRRKYEPAGPGKSCRTRRFFAFLLLLALLLLFIIGSPRVGAELVYIRRRDEHDTRSGRMMG